MKKLILCAALALSFSAQAQGSHCDAIGVLARSVMGARQSGVAIEKMMAIAESEPKTQELVTRVVMAAYERPQFRTETMKNQEVIVFGNDMAFACYQGAQQRKR